MVILSISLLTSCYYIWPVYPEEEPYEEDTRQYAYVTSANLFVYKGRSCIACKALLPAEIYNPNNYAITVTADGTDYIIAPLGTLELKEDKAK
jgi:hypothetical protein